MWHLTRDNWHVTPDTWHMTRDMWHMMGGEHSFKISAPQLLWFGIDSTLNIFPQTMTESVNESINYGGDCRTAPATPGLLIRLMLSVRKDTDVVFTY